MPDHVLRVGTACNPPYCTSYRINRNDAPTTLLALFVNATALSGLRAATSILYVFNEKLPYNQISNVAAIGTPNSLALVRDILMALSRNLKLPRLFFLFSSHTLVHYFIGGGSLASTGELHRNTDRRLCIRRGFRQRPRWRLARFLWRHLSSQFKIYQQFCRECLGGRR